MAVSISVKSNLDKVIKNLGAAAGKQIDFAAALALSQLAKEVAADQTANFKETFKTPRPFTVNSIGTKGANKKNLTARVFVKPIAAKYLEPYETGGVHVLPARSLLNPKNVRLDKYGQLPRKTLERLKARKDVFVGPVRFKKTRYTVTGVWQRPHIREKPRKVKPGQLKGKETRGTRFGMDEFSHTSGRGRLLLLIRFGDALPVPSRLKYQARAQALVDRRFNKVFGASLAYAMATAK